MTLDEALDMLMRGETTEQYKKRKARIRRLANERDELMDAIQVLSEEPVDHEKVAKKSKRLEKVLQMIEELK